MTDTSTTQKTTMAAEEAAIEDLAKSALEHVDGSPADASYLLEQAAQKLWELSISNASNPDT